MSSTTQQLEFILSDASSHNADGTELTRYQRVSLAVARFHDSLAQKLEREGNVSFTLFILLLLLSALPIFCLLYHGFTASDEVMVIDIVLSVLLSVPVGLFDSFILFASGGDIIYWHEELCERYNIPGNADFDWVEERIYGEAHVSSKTIKGIPLLVEEIKSKNDEWMRSVLSTLSLGKSKSIPIPISEYRKRIGSVSREEAKHIIKEMESEYKTYIKELEELVELWDEALGNMISVHLSDPVNTVELNRIAERFDVEIMIDSYYAGVPVEDIIA